MDLINNTSSANLFSATIQNSTNLESLSNSALSNGIDLYIQKDYKGAIKEFQRSIGLSLNSSYSTQATEYMANAYLKLDETENAIKTYKRAISLNTTSDELHIKLGNLFYAQERYQEAQNEYEKAVELNPTAQSHYSLGQACLETGRYMDAHTQFNKVHRLDPKSPNGKYGIGLAYSKQERYEEAIRMFQDTIGKKKDFYDAYAEMGYAYADLGRMDEAQEIVDFLDPDYVYYDAKAFTATVKFTIKQNENADGTIDPSHIEFAFKGKDKYGLTMDSDFDQVTGFSGIA